jgi:hypothetical protein
MKGSPRCLATEKKARPVRCTSRTPSRTRIRAWLRGASRITEPSRSATVTVWFSPVTISSKPNSREAPGHPPRHVASAPVATSSTAAAAQRHVCARRARTRPRSAAACSTSSTGGGVVGAGRAAAVACSTSASSR